MKAKIVSLNCEFSLTLFLQFIFRNLPGTYLEDSVK